MARSLLGGSALAALFAATLTFYPVPSAGETLAKKTQPQPVADKGTVNTAAATTRTTPASKEAVSAAPAHSFTATAYALRGRTASGRQVSRGLIAADRRVLPLGTRVRLDAGPYSGEYLVADTGGAVRGRKIDIWMPSNQEALRFGRRPVKLTVLTRERNRAPKRS